MEPVEWWINTSRMWIIRAFGNRDEPYFQTNDFDELLKNNIYNREMPFQAIAKEWDISLEVLAELVADHIRRLE